MENELLNKIKFLLKEEEINIIREFVQTGEVNWHKEVLTEEKGFTVPVKREEIIIEKKFADMKSPMQQTRTETIRIPLREERVEIRKYTFDLDDVVIFKQQQQRTESIDTTLKKEVMLLQTSGNPILRIEEL